MSHQGQPLQIVNLRADHTYELDEANLKSILMRPDIKDKNVVVISVVGAFRKGKSFLLNFILRFLESGCNKNWLDNVEDSITGFHWRGGVDRATTGILMWSEPFIVDGVAVLLMDTQGTFDNQTTVKDTCTIFSLSTLLSSVQIYNLQNNLQENDLQHLQLFTEYGRLVLNETRNVPFQRLIFLIRDWEKEYEHPFGWTGGQQIVQAFLNQNDQHADLQSVREHITKCFAGVAGFLMIHPGREVVKQREFAGTLANLEPEFLELMKQFVPAIFGDFKATRKVVCSNVIKCGELFEYFRMYTQLFASDKLPVPTTLFQATAEANNLTALNEATSFFQEGVAKLMSSKVPLAQDQLNRDLQTLSEAAKKQFDSVKKIGGQEISERFLRDLEETFNMTIKDCLIQNEHKLEAVRIEAKLKTERDTEARQRLEAERQAAKSREEAAKQARLAQEAERLRQQAEQREREFRNQIGQLKDEVSSLSENLNRERQQAEQRNSQLQNKIEELNSSFADSQRQLQEMRNRPQQHEFSGFGGGIVLVQRGFAPFPPFFLR